MIQHFGKINGRSTKPYMVLNYSSSNNYCYAKLAHAVLFMIHNILANTIHYYYYYYIENDLA